MAKKLTSAKAKKILHDKSVHGKPLTDKQRKFFGAVASGVIKAQNGIEGTMGGLTDIGFDYNGAWGGTMQMGGSLPGATGMMYARVGAPSNGPYAKKTKPSAQDGMEVNNTDIGDDGGGGGGSDYIKLDPARFSLTTTRGVSETFDPTNPQWTGQSTEWLQKRISNAELLVQAIKDAKSLTKDQWQKKYKGASFAAVGGGSQPILPDFYNDYKKRDDAFIQDWSQARDQAKNELLMQSRWTVNKEKAKKEALDFLNQYKGQNEFLSNLPTEAAKKYGYTPGELENLSPWEFLSKDAVAKAYYAINANKGFPLPQDPTNEMTCANGVCTIENMIGVDFSPMKGGKGVYYDKDTGMTIPQYNPTWLENENYKKVGYRKLDNLNELPQPGDIVQYSDEKGVPGHMELVLGNLPNGLIVYNNYSQTNDNRPGEGKEVRGYKPGTYQQLATDNFAQTNYFRLTPEAQQKALSRNPTYLKKVEGKKAFESSEDYKRFVEVQNFINANQEKYKKFSEMNPENWRNGGRTSAQNGEEMRFYQEGLDFKPKTISQDGSKTKKARQPKRVIVFAERPLGEGLDNEAFVTEAQNVKNFYKRTSPNTKVEILPVYETGDNKTKQKIQDTLYGLTPDDDVMVFGHHGEKYAGIPTPQWASLLEDSNYGNCYLGSCTSEDVATGPWRNVRNLNYRPATVWLGFNPNASNITDAMFSRGASAPPLTEDEMLGQYIPMPQRGPETGSEADYQQQLAIYERAVAAYNAVSKKRASLIQKPIKGQDYQTRKGLPQGIVTSPFSFSNPFEYNQRQTGLPFTLRPPRPTAKKEDGGWLSKYDDGGIIEDPMGQWAHPGEITRIPSNEITMQGVDYPVMGISDTGDTQMMQPGQDYTFDGNSVTEIPMMQRGGQVNDPGYSEPDYVTGTSRRAINKMIGMGNYLLPANVLNQAADFAKAKGLDYGANTSGPADAVRHASSAASTAARLPIPKLISQYSPALDRAMRIAATNALGLGYELRNFNLDGALMDLKNNYQGSLVGSIPGLSDKERNKMIVNQLTNKQLTVDNPKRKKENGGWLSKYE